MQLTDVQAQILAPTFARLLPGQFESPEAHVMLLAIGLQESRFENRKQIGGPARGFWQFEERGGVWGVLNHESSRLYARSVCLLRAVAPTTGDVYRALAHDDMLACAVARLLLWTDPGPLPRIGDVEGAWNYYLRNWRPGKPHRSTWNGLYDQARKAVTCA